MKIKKISFLLFFSIALFGCGKVEQTEPIKTQVVTKYDGKILALGDSLTEGYRLEKSESYPAQLKQFLTEKGYNYQVIKSGISGETSTGLESRIDWTLSQTPDIIILASGANDAIRGIDLDITKKNLATVIQTIQEKNIPLIFGGMQIYENLGNDYVNQFKNLYPSLAQEYKLNFIPFFLEGVAGNPTLNITDQIHPNKEGYQIIVEKNIWPTLKPLLKK